MRVREIAAVSSLFEMTEDVYGGSGSLYDWGMGAIGLTVDGRNGKGFWDYITPDRRFLPPMMRIQVTGFSVFNSRS
jgi:hypothetical protein